MMTLWKKKDGPQPQPQSKLEKRVASLSTSDLVTSVETALFSIGKNVAGLGEKTPQSYEEAVWGAEAVLAMCKELKRRADDR
jgi:hypothetical protein